jgi:phospholipid/cholesterol/gamma-HCH transport system substrate-binding protein
MNTYRLRQNLGFLLVLGVIAVVGVFSAITVLSHERLPDPFIDTYNVRIELSAADGVVPGYGQPVNVAGVPVGVIAGAKVGEDGNAMVTLAIRRSSLPHVYRDATAALEPVTPLKDMELDLVPGQASAGVLPAGGVIPVADTTSPGELEDLLGALDGDTRSFMQTLISSLGTGTAGEGANLRRLLIDLGPTGGQLRSIDTALVSRRSEIAELVHNLSVVTHAASQDGELASVVQAGDATLHAVASQDAALGRSIALFPAALHSTGAALTDATGLARAIGPAVTALTPAVRRLPATLAAVGPFASKTSRALRTEIGPLTRDAEPALGQLAPAVTALAGELPDVTSIVAVLRYLTNELAYNPGGDDPGMLFWVDWAAHNTDSATGNEDAMGSIARTLVLVSCQQLTEAANVGKVLGEFLGVGTICEH